MNRFLNHYRCEHDDPYRSGHGQPVEEWEDESEYMNNDKCPVCNAEIEPYQSDDINVDKCVIIDGEEYDREAATLLAIKGFIEPCTHDDCQNDYHAIEGVSSGELLAILQRHWVRN